MRTHRDINVYRVYATTLCSFCHLDEMEQAESAVYYLCKRITLCIRNLKQTAEDGDGNVGRTVRLITEDKKRT